MAEHTITLQKQEFELVQAIRNSGQSREIQDAVIENLIREIETMFAQQQPPQKTIKWLQVGNSKHFREFKPVKPKAGAPLASDIIIAQRS